MLDLFVLIQVAQFLQKAFEGLLFREATIVIDFSGISRIERNPEKDKAAIFIFGHFSALQPA